jgi:hypothetical protein
MSEIYTIVIPNSRNADAILADALKFGLPDHVYPDCYRVFVICLPGEDCLLKAKAIRLDVGDIIPDNGYRMACIMNGGTTKQQCWIWCNIVYTVEDDLHSEYRGLDKRTSDVYVLNVQPEGCEQILVV